MKRAVTMNGSFHIMRIAKEDRPFDAQLERLSPDRVALYVRSAPNAPRTFHRWFKTEAAARLAAWETFRLRV